MAQVDHFINEEILPYEKVYRDQLVGSSDYRKWQIPPIMNELKAKAKDLGLWNLFLPDVELGAGLNNCDYSPIAELMGRSPIAPEVFNCSAPDTGNAEVLYRYGSSAQKEQWLTPLLDGVIRSRR